MLEKLFVDPKPLDKESDKEIRVKPITNFKHATSLNIVPLYAGEVREACKTYPVIFVKDTNGYMPLAVTGHVQGENNFVNKEGRWKENAYIPSLVRMYPFAVAENNGQFFIVADRNYKGFNKEGDRIFNDDGTMTELGNAISKNVSEVFSALRFTSELFKEIEDLLKEVNLTFDKNGKKYQVTEVLIVDEEKLNVVTNKRLAELKEKNILPVIYQHLISLTNRV